MAGEPYNFFPETTSLLDSDISLISRSPHTSGLTRKHTMLTVKNYILEELGTMSVQNSDAVSITGGTINGTTIGATVASTIRGTTITATSLSTAGVVHNSAAGLLSTSLIVTADITANSVTNEKSAKMAPNTFKGNITGVLADPQDLTVSEMQDALGIETTTALTDTFIGFGSAGNVLTGSSSLTWNGTTLSVTGTAKISSLTTGVVHSNGTGDLTSSLIVGADITNLSITGAKIALGTVGNSNLANAGPNTLKGNNTGGSAPPSDLSVADVQAMLGISGGITIGLNQIGYGTAANNLNGSPDFIFDPVTGAMTIGSGTLDSTALVQMISTTKTFMPPSMTTAQRLAIVPSQAGGLVFDKDLVAWVGWNGSAWSILG